jgi:hypothetical protein
MIIYRIELIITAFLISYAGAKLAMMVMAKRKEKERIKKNK